MVYSICKNEHDNRAKNCFMHLKIPKMNTPTNTINRKIHHPFPVTYIAVWTSAHKSA